MPEAIRQGDIPGVQLRRRQSLVVEVGEAWGWLTEAQRLERWLAEHAEVLPGPHGRLLLAGRDEMGAEQRHAGSTLEIVAPRLWRLAFERLDAGWPAPTQVTFELRAIVGGAELSVLHEGFQRLSLTTCLTIWESYRRYWREGLERLARETGAG
jgi:Activator of Hsp90 ATPase homolog 1-like protein